MRSRVDNLGVFWYNTLEIKRKILKKYFEVIGNAVFTIRVHKVRKEVRRACKKLSRRGKMSRLRRGNQT